MDELTKLAVKYKSDRHPMSKHGYTPFYYEIFKDRRESVKKILEIGIDDGRGLRMWRDFFPDAMIYGIDNLQKWIFKDERIDTYLCDQSNLKDLSRLINKIGTDIDFVVDDGSHVPEHQVFTCLTLMPYLKKDVIYVIEDVIDLDSVQWGLAGYNHRVPALVPARRKFNKFGQPYIDRLVVVENRK